MKDLGDNEPKDGLSKDDDIPPGMGQAQPIAHVHAPGGMHMAYVQAMPPGP